MQRLIQSPLDCRTEVCILSPSSTVPHPGCHVHPYVRFGFRTRTVTSAAIGTACEIIENGVWNEAAAHRQNMTIAMPVLLGAEEPQRLHQVQVLPGAGHRDVEEPAFFLDLRRAADRHVRRDAAVGDVEHEHSIPFLAFRGMDRG
jgi:hypothetical protein